MKRTVLIPSLPTRFDAATKQRVPSFDFNPAAKYGELKIVMDAPIPKTSIPDALTEVEQAAQKMQPDDLILLVGDFVVAAAMIAHACAEHGTANVMRWDKLKKGYEILEVKL